MKGYLFSEYKPKRDKRTDFERLLDVFLEILTHTSGDVEEAIDWLRQIDREHQLTNDNYSIDDFINELKEKGFLKDGSENGKGIPILSSKGEQAIRQRALDQVFGKMKRGGLGQHQTNKLGQGDEQTEDRRPFQFGDKLEQIDFSESFRNAQINHGIGGDFRMDEGDLEVRETMQVTSMSTVLMIDLSHSMILYGEDRITPAKKVAMALSEMIMRKYPKDNLDIVAFGNDAWEVSVKDLPYLKVGPYHTNTVAGLERAMDILRRRKTSNKQIFMITDGKPSCLKENGEYYMNSFGLDPYITGKCFNLARQCRKQKIPITTFMIATDPYLQEFINDFTEANSGKAFFTGLDGLGDMILQDFERNRRKRL
ncbi:MAG: hypothetical protein P8N19_08915 [Flavobacteriales bacterium]|nr:hypothetical protein [Flavobacteriales bacterium]MDG1766252.1 hypothetical protein [Flavobacteriales bacterium]